MDEQGHRVVSLVKSGFAPVLTCDFICYMMELFGHARMYLVRDEEGVLVPL